MNLLLDTNAILWMSDDRKQSSLGKNAKRLIITSQITYVSAISFVEIYMKVMLGKLKLRSDIKVVLEAEGLVQLDFTAEQAESINVFQSLVKHDPFDRMLLAQAQAESLLFLTADQLLIDLGLSFIRDARQ